LPDRFTLIDGGADQAGWQLTRSAMILAAVTGTPVRVINILTHRPLLPGLRPIHIPTLKAIAAVSGCDDFEPVPGSTQLELTPGSIRSGDFKFDAGPNGSAGILLQSVAVPLAFAPGPSTVEVTGITHAPRMPTFEYLTHVWANLLRQVGIDLMIDMPQVGFYPQGGGRLTARIAGGCRPSSLHPFRPEQRGEQQRIFGTAKVAGLPIRVGQFQRVMLERALRQADFDLPIKMETLHSTAAGTICYVGMDFEAGPAGFSSIGGSGKPGEMVAEELADQVIQFHRDPHHAVLDPSAPDQILIPLALAPGTSRFTTSALTSSTLGLGDLVSKMLGRRFGAQGRLMRFGKIELI
jgi:RNA 3'-terminal phosphate cyclase (ATP)